ncbi:MAG: alkaline phosphatase D family protein [Nocardioidaceae bacterium]
MSAEETGRGQVTRRVLLRGAATSTVIGAAAWSQLPAQALLPPGSTPWLGRDYWANRLQDWARRNGRFECVAQPGNRLVRTVAVLTRSIAGAPAEIRVRTGTLQAGRGYSGFLIGTGTPESHPLAAALVFTASGTGGGIFAVYDADGQVRFRDHTDEQNPFSYAKLPFTASGPAPARRLGEDIDLVLAILADGPGRVRLRLRAIDRPTGRLLSEAVMSGVERTRVQGGLSLVSSDRANSGARYWFRSLQTSGAGVGLHPGRAFGPVAGTLFSRAGSELRMTVQVLPDEALRGARVVVQTQGLDGIWRAGGSGTVGVGFTARIVAGSWPSGRAVPYRVVLPSGVAWSGTVPAEPTQGMVVASINCVKASHRPTDSATSGAPSLPGSRPLGLYSSRNIYFPFDQLAGSIGTHEPDMLVVHGDQFYETSPTRRGAMGELEFLYKYLLWLWSFRELTRRIPTIVLIDDHDVFQPNLWGHGGRAAPGGDIHEGGYTGSADFVNLIQRVQCGHNPRPFDPTPVARGIGVYYTSFAYGGVSFAVVEDRKFKTGPDSDAAETNPILLGTRQENFLRDWAGRHPALPKVLLSQTVYAAVHTDEAGAPVADMDTNGWPRVPRNRALGLIRDAGAVMLAGDQHLGTLVRHGLQTFDDGPIQFTAPGGSTSFQRWFEPAGELPRAGATPFTGEWTDAFGNRLLSLAVVNPSFSQAEFREHHPDSNGFGDRGLKSEGYGILRIDPEAREYTFEAWRWDSDPTDAAAEQYPGWPYVLSFDDV